MTEADFREQSADFLARLFLEIHRKKIEILEHWDIDHICYRVDSEALYQQRKSDFADFADLLGETEVSGRMISTFQLRTPISYRGRRIDLVELPAPKPGKVTSTGFEHIEVVCDVSFSHLELKYRELNLDLGGVAKPFNAEFEIILGEGSLKFHHLSLASVIRLERNQRVWQALQDLKIFRDFKTEKPLIAGTFPLGLDTKKSDIDILLSSKILGNLKSKIDGLWLSQDAYKSRLSSIDGLTTLTVNFNFRDVPIEIFAQDKETIKQPAYLHFLIEERLLKIGGESFRQQIVDLKSQMKTEAAFAKVLGFEGDPYVGMTRLQKMSSQDLKELIESAK